MKFEELVAYLDEEADVIRDIEIEDFNGNTICSLKDLDIADIEGHTLRLQINNKKRMRVS